MVREAKLQYSATITTPTDILFPTTSILGVLSALRPEEREESARGGGSSDGVAVAATTGVAGVR